MAASEIQGKEEADLTIVPVLPCAWGAERSAGAMPDDLIGATIKSIGMPAFRPRKHEGGGLAIEYIPSGSRFSKMVIFAFNDEGMWISK